MNKKVIVAGVIHKLPADMERALTSDAQTLAKWNSLTPIQRNEWICWITVAKRPETRAEHVERMVLELNKGE